MLYEKGINTAAETVFKGGIVIIPTDTIYGFSCDPRNDQAVSRIRQIKARDSKPFIILDSSLGRIKGQYFNSDNFINEVIDVMVSEKLWPGRITVIADKNKNLELDFLKENSKIAVRYTDNNVVKTICDKISFGIVSTSINISGEKEVNDISLIRADWTGRADFILERNTLGEKASTIIELFPIERNIRFLREPDKESTEKIKKIISDRFEICR
ncbi:TPA: hypothetical protein DCR49_02805 [Candidatus Delongbacteria bacterium]|nr:MAG: hypothetical protein A2Y39_04935 [Candidatus Delongbacteria bacterium GWF2_40_14]HAQ60921.1 hypothetical protein [Candidatus Delongbacteria bacterium]